MSLVTRKEWGARPPKPGPGLLERQNVLGVAFHWPAMAKPLKGIPAVSAALRSWQAYHMDVKGWSDIAYQVAFDQDGNRYVLRGRRRQSGANGGTRQNEQYGAYLLVLAPGEQPTAAMIRAVRKGVADFRAEFPAGKLIVGHSQIRPEPTACPGPIVLDMIKRGVFEPRSTTRGTAVDAALRALDGAKGTGDRLRRIREARKQLEGIDPL